MAIELTDDGTMDTVLRCSECGEEFRFTHDGLGIEDEDDRIAALLDANPGMTEARATDLLGEVLYEEWVDSCIAEIESEHECPQDEPQEDDITTGDHKRFYMYGRLILEQDDTRENRWYGYDSKRRQFIVRADTCEKAIRIYMDEVKFWPNVWFISDHGNAHRMTL